MRARTRGVLWGAALAAVAGAAIGAFVLLTQPAPTLAQDTSPASSSKTIVVTGEGTVQAPPDAATVRLGVQEQAGSAVDAIDAVNRQMSQVINALTALGIPSSAIQTQGLSVYPVRDQLSGGGNGPVRFQASNTIAIELDGVSQVGTVIDTAMKAGANQVSGVRFHLRDQDAVRNQAISEAVNQARAKAQTIARSLNVQLGSAQSASLQGTNTPAPLNAAAMAATPVAPGELDFTVQVRVTFTIS